MMSTSRILRMIIFAMFMTILFGAAIAGVAAIFGTVITTSMIPILIALGGIGSIIFTPLIAMGVKL